MHLNMIGTSADDIGSALVEMVTEDKIEGDVLPDVALLEVTNKMRRWCQMHNLTCTRRTLSMKVLGRDALNPRAFPGLSSKIKAAQTKVIQVQSRYVKVATC